MITARGQRSERCLKTKRSPTKKKQVWPDRRPRWGPSGSSARGASGTWSGWRRRPKPKGWKRTTFSPGTQNCDYFFFSLALFLLLQHILCVRLIAGADKLFVPAEPQGCHIRTRTRPTSERICQSHSKRLFAKHTLSSTPPCGCKCFVCLFVTNRY